MALDSMVLGGDEQALPEQTSRPRFHADIITEALSKRLDELLGEGDFTLGDVVGGVEVLLMQTKEQILINVRKNIAEQDKAVAQQAHMAAQMNTMQQHQHTQD